MHDIKDTGRAVVRIGYDGRVHKTFRGHFARERFAHEVRVLRYLEERGCTFVPRILEAEPETLKMVTTNCGQRVDQLAPERQAALFAELEQFGVRHEDRELRNITYRVADGRFCIIDFEFATILDDGTGQPVTLKPTF
jgi:tRNA A-37 threonylcarbamoyl transferase component Bud32